MTIRLTRLLRSKNGTTETSSSVFEKDSILLGRGGESDIILEGQGISLQHARLSKADGSFVVEDLESLSGVTVNGKLIRRHVLKNGDVLKLADHAFTISVEGTEVELRESPRADTVSAEETLRQQVEALSFKSAFPSMKLLSFGFMLAVLLASALPYIREQRMLWSSGPITNHHKMIEASCASCHEGNFTKVADTKCLSCHELSSHAESFLSQSNAHKGVLDRACVSCHQEHESSHALIQKDSKLCISCHATIDTILPGSTLANVTSWEEHPEFSVRLKTENSQSPVKVSLADKSALIDNSHIKLNHELHLKPDLRGKDGPVTLQCHDCHKLSANGTTMAPLTMENNCSACHTLGFDERLPEAHVPHGTPDLVYKFLYAEYAKLLLGEGEVRTGNTRLRPGADQAAQSTPAFARPEIVKLARDAERELFTRTACKLCHEVAELSDVEPTSDKSRYEVLDPLLPVSWMPSSQFNHASHEEVSCESCHHGVKTSSKTQDILLPKMEDCKACHAGHAVTGKVTTNCIDCHSYHDPLPLNPAKKRTLENIVTSLGTP